jgi:hypothetical protein
VWIVKAPVLPENPGRLKDVRLELWLHSTATEAQDLVKLSKLPLAKALVHKYLATILPELAALAENRSLDSVGPWLVISIGAPKAGRAGVSLSGPGWRTVPVQNSAPGSGK